MIFCKYVVFQKYQLTEATNNYSTNALATMSATVVLLLVLLWGIDVCGSFYQSGTVFPVYRFWKNNNPQQLLDLNSEHRSFGVSLHPLVEAKLVRPLLKRSKGALVGAFGVQKLRDLEELYEAGCRLVCVHVSSQELIREAKLKDMTVICSGARPSEYHEAVMMNTDGFSLIWDKPARYRDAVEFVDKIRLTSSHLDIPLFISPVLEGNDLENIAALDGMINFMISFYVGSEGDPERVAQQVSALNARLRKAYLDLRIQGDVHNSCL